MFEKLRERFSKKERGRTLRKMTGQPEPFTPPEGAKMGGEQVKESREERFKRRGEEARKDQEEYNRYLEKKKKK